MYPQKEEKIMMLFRAVKQTDATRLAELRRPGAAPEVQRALSAAAIAQELDSLTPVYPCLVAEIDGQVEACAFAAPLRPESAYQWDVELHIFVSEERRRQGVGSALLLRLMRVLSVQGFLQLCAAVTLPDEASQGFLTACGFAAAGTLPDVAYRDGEWRDLMWMMRPLAEKPAYPTPPTPFESFEKEELAALIL